MAYPHIIDFPMNLNPTLAAELTRINAIVASYSTTISTSTETLTLCEHAIERKYMHPGVEKYLQMKTAMLAPAPESHGGMFKAAVMKFDSLAVKDEASVLEWKKEVEPLVGKMKSCAMALRVILGQEVVKAFVAIEREVVAGEGGGEAMETD